MAKITDIRIDEPTWRGGTALRKSEWRAACADLLVECNYNEALNGGYLLFSSMSDEIRVEVLDDDGYTQRSFSITRVALASLIDEYTEIIKRLDENVSARDATWFEAVDMAKKVVHDRAGNRLMEIVPELSVDLPTLRKIFTLVLALFIDTTALRHARGHGVSAAAFRKSGRGG